MILRLLQSTKIEDLDEVVEFQEEMTRIDGKETREQKGDSAQSDSLAISLPLTPGHRNITDGPSILLH